MSDRTLWQLERSLIEELEENKADILTEPHPEDTVSEYVDGTVPVYYSDILAVAQHDTDMALNEPELGPANDGTPTPINIITANIYEYLSYAGTSWLQDQLLMQDDDDDSEEA